MTATHARRPDVIAVKLTKICNGDIVAAAALAEEMGSNCEPSWTGDVYREAAALLRSQGQTSAARERARPDESGDEEST